jgi:hypothetical protein
MTFSYRRDSVARTVHPAGLELRADIALVSKFSIKDRASCIAWSSVAAAPIVPPLLCGLSISHSQP